MAGNNSVPTTGFIVRGLKMVEAEQLFDFIPAVQSLAGIKSDTIKLQGINRLAAAERGDDIYATECSV